MHTTPATERIALGQHLLAEALDRAEHPADAVSALVSAAASILARNFGEEGALALLTNALDETGAKWRAAHAN